MNVQRAPRSKREITFDEAFAYCLTLRFRGYKDWRLPNLEEFQELGGEGGSLWFYEYHPDDEFDYSDDEIMQFVIPVRDKK